MVVIPFKDFPAFNEEVTLDDTPYRLKFAWNTRGEYWTLQINDREENELIRGIKLVLGIELIQQYPDRGLPPGALLVQDPANGYQKIGKDDFVNDRALQLVYVTEDEL